MGSIHYESRQLCQLPFGEMLLKPIASILNIMFPTRRLKRRLLNMHGKAPIVPLKEVTLREKRLITTFTSPRRKLKIFCFSKPLSSLHIVHGSEASRLHGLQTWIPSSQHKIDMDTSDVLTEYELEDLDEPPNYKAALADPESEKWLEAMNTEMQSMKDNQVWILVELPPNGQTFRSKWIFKKNTDMDLSRSMTMRFGKWMSRQPFVNGTPRTPYNGAQPERLQASKSWNKRFDEDIKKIDFTQNPDEPCVYLKASRREATYILGIKIICDRSKRLIVFSQSAYLKKILMKFRMENSKKRYTSMMEKLDYRKSQGAKTPIKQNPSEIHWTAVKIILKYLKNTKDMVLVYGAKPEDELKVSCYAAASFQTDRDGTKSQMGYMFILNGGAVDWKSAKQSTTAISST
ncbi:hypothetical protein Tco_1163524 [Tanacetum coccineum]